MSKSHLNCFLKLRVVELCAKASLKYLRFEEDVDIIVESKDGKMFLKGLNGEYQLDLSITTVEC